MRLLYNHLIEQAYPMTDKDFLQRFIFDKAPVRGEFIRLQQSLSTIIHQHPYPPAIRQLLSEALCVAGLLGAIIKFSGRLTVQFRGKGKLKLLLAQCDNHFQIRGLAKWKGDLSYEDLMKSFHQGVLVITLDSGPGKNSYQGIVAWRGNSLVESIEGYFKESEQLATKIWLATNENTASGLLLQVIPGSEKTSIDKDVIKPHWDHIVQLTSNIESNDMLNLDYQTLLNQLYSKEDVRIFPSVPITFHCSCSRKRGEDAIAILGQAEAEEALKTNHVIMVTCDFCNKEYIFDRVDIAKIFKNKDEPPSKTHLH